MLGSMPMNRSRWPAFALISLVAVPAASQVSFAGLDQAVAAAKADAAVQAGVPATELQVTAAEALTWRNGGIGCPRKGVLYTDALVPGYRVWLRGAGRDWDYHASQAGALVLCTPARARDPLPDSRK